MNNLFKLKHLYSTSIVCSKHFVNTSLVCSKHSYPLFTNINKCKTIISKPLIMSANQSTNAAPVELSKTEKLKQAFKDYGTTVVLFHIGMSLCSVGVWYLIVSCGLDVPELLKKINIDESKLQLASGASTFVVAYTLHKLTAPIRISITLASAPFIVSYLRRIGILKTKKAIQTAAASTSAGPNKSSSETPLMSSDKTSDKV